MTWTGRLASHAVLGGRSTSGRARLRPWGAREAADLLAPGRVVAHRTPAQYRTVMVPKTVMVAPEGVAYERIAPQYATQERTEMVSPGYSYYAPVQQTCNTCGGYGYGYGRY